MRGEISILRVVTLGPFLFLAMVIAAVVKLFVYLYELTGTRSTDMQL